jgi:hypothetical protein
MNFETPKLLPHNQFTNLQLYCGKDGILRVKNGLTLEEYLNHPNFVKSRKAALKKSKSEDLKFVMVDEHFLSKISMPHSA